MARIRSIKPELWASPKLARVSRDARLLFIGLFNQADDSGRCEAVPRMLLGAIFPWDQDVTEEDVVRWLNELSREGLARLYMSDSRSYLFLPGWSKHQRVDNPSRPRCPDPDGEGSQILEALTCGYPLSRDTLDTSSRDPSETLALGALDRRSVGALEENLGVADATPNQPALLVDEAPPAAGVPAVRKRDVIFDALVETCGLDLGEVTRPARQALNKAARDLREVGATPEGIRARGQVHRERWPQATLTPSSLAKNYAQLGVAATQPVHQESKSARYANAYEEAAAALERMGR